MRLDLNMLGLILLCSLLPVSFAQYDGLPKRRDHSALPPHNHQQNHQQQPREPTHFQYSSFGSQSDSTESAPVSLGPFTRNPHVSYQNRLEDRLYGTRDYEGRQGIARDYEGRQGITRDYESHRNARYQEGVRGVVANDHVKSNALVRPWHSTRPEDHRARQRRPRISNSRKEALRIRENLLYDGKSSAFREVKRNPRIVKYIADNNGFAVREDLVRPLQETIDRTRQESRRRVVTASASGSQQNSLMSQVVTSAIRVAGQPPAGGDGKFLPQIFDLKLGKKQSHFDVDRQAYPATNRRDFVL